MDGNKVYAFRLKPGEDLRNGIDVLVKENYCRMDQYLRGESY